MSKYTLLCLSSTSWVPARTMNVASVTLSQEDTYWPGECSVQRPLCWGLRTHVCKEVHSTPRPAGPHSS